MVVSSLLQPQQHVDGGATTGATTLLVMNVIGTIGVETLVIARHHCRFYRASAH